MISAIRFGSPLTFKGIGNAEPHQGPSDQPFDPSQPLESPAFFTNLASRAGKAKQVSALMTPTATLLKFTLDGVQCELRLEGNDTGTVESSNLMCFPEDSVQMYQFNPDVQSGLTVAKALLPVIEKTMALGKGLDCTAIMEVLAERTQRQDVVWEPITTPEFQFYDSPWPVDLFNGGVLRAKLPPQSGDGTLFIAKDTRPGSQPRYYLGIDKPNMPPQFLRIGDLRHKPALNVADLFKQGQESEMRGFQKLLPHLRFPHS